MVGTLLGGGGANPHKDSRGDETVWVWNHWQFLCHWELWAVFDLWLYGLPSGQQIKQHWASLLSRLLILSATALAAQKLGRD